MKNKNYTLLLVEDNELNLLMLRRRLEKHDFNILECSDGRDLIARVERFCPDMILMDMALPGINGWDLTRMLKSSPRTSAIPVIAITAHAFPDDEERSRAAGCDDYISKPINFQHLLMIVSSLLRKAAPRLHAVYELEPD